MNHVGLVLDHLALPAIALAFAFVGLLARYLRSSLLDTLDEPYITVARAKGLPERTVLLRHLRVNALVTFIPAVVSDFGLIFGAALAIDAIFQLGGIGTLFIGDLRLTVDGVVPVDTYALELALLLGGALVLTASGRSAGCPLAARSADEARVVAAVGAQPVTARPPARRRRGSARLVRRVARQPAALVSGIVLAVIFVVGALVPVIVPRTVESYINLSDRWRNHPPLLSGWHFLGTDGIGRDVVVRVRSGDFTRASSRRCSRPCSRRSSASPSAASRASAAAPATR